MNGRVQVIAIGGLAIVAIVGVSFLGLCVAWGRPLDAALVGLVSAATGAMGGMLIPNGGKGNNNGDRKP